MLIIMTARGQTPGRRLRVRRIGLILLCLSLSVSSPAWANRIGGMCFLNRATLGGDADAFGQQIASALEYEIGGTWGVENQARLGFGLGGYYTFFVSPSFSLQLEMLYAQRGNKYEFMGRYPGETITITETFKFDYIDFPVLGRFSPQTSGPIRPIFLVGPVLGVKMSSKLQAEAGSSSNTSDISQGMNSMYVGMMLGGGCSARIGSTSSLVVQARYHVGLTNLIDDPMLTLRPSDLSFHVGIEFRVPNSYD